MDDFGWGGSDYSVDDNFDSGWNDVVDDSSNYDPSTAGDLGWDSSGSSPGMGDTPAPDSDWNTQPGGTDWTSPSAGTGYPWSSALLSAGGAVLKGAGDMYKDKQDWKARTEFMKAQLAEQEKYYQLHGKQLSDALGGYAKYAGQNASPVANNFGLLAGNGGVSGYFH